MSVLVLDVLFPLFVDVLCVADFCDGCVFPPFFLRIFCDVLCHPCHFIKTEISIKNQITIYHRNSECLAPVILV